MHMLKENIPAQGQHMLTIGDVAQQLNISPELIRELVDTKQLSAFEQAGELQFTQEDVNAYILVVFAAIDDDDNDDEVDGDEWDEDAA